MKQKIIYFIITFLAFLLAYFAFDQWKKKQNEKQTDHARQEIINEIKHNLWFGTLSTKGSRDHIYQLLDTIYSLDPDSDNSKSILIDARSEISSYKKLIHATTLNERYLRAQQSGVLKYFDPLELDYINRLYKHHNKLYQACDELLVLLEEEIKYKGVRSRYDRRVFYDRLLETDYQLYFRDINCGLYYSTFYILETDPVELGLPKQEEAMPQ